MTLGLTGVEPLKDLAGDLDKELEIAGFEMEKRGFHAHITLGRMKSVVRAGKLLSKSLKAPAGAVLKVDCLQLVSSRLTQTGSEYTINREFRLPP